MKMMKTTLFAIAAMAAVSCVKENIQDNTSSEVNANLVELTITAGTENGETKAAFSEDAYPQIVWQGNEEISVLGASTGNQKFTTTSTGNKAVFNGLADLSDDVLYAVYPHDAEVSLTNDGKISKVTVPAVQTATAGSFDPKAYIAVAKSTDKNLTFKAVGGFVKFKLEDATNVKSVTMVSNAGANMACTATVAFNDNGSVSHGSPYVADTESTSVKLEGTFETGKEYFMVVRPQPYTGGVTLYIEYTDGTVLSRKGTADLFESGKGRNYIRNLGTLKKTDFTKVDGLYVLYNMGYDITVGDLTVNKETHPTASIVDITEANTNMTANFKTGGVYFINQNENCSFTIAGYVNVAKDLIIISNNPSKKVNYNHPAYYFNLANGTFAMKGVSVNLGTRYMINNSMCTNNTGKIIFDDCSISNAGASLYYGSKADIGISLFQFNKCDIVTTNTIQLLNLNTTVMNDYTNIKFTDCTFSSASMTAFILVNSATATQTGTAPTSALEVKNCTFHNLRPNPSFINVPWCGNLKFNKNLVSIYSLTADVTMIKTNTDNGNLSSTDVSDNFYYVYNFNGKTLKTKPSDSQSVKSEPTYMFNTNTFAVKAEYAGYGATR